MTQFKQLLLEEEINEMEAKIQAVLFLSENVDILTESDELLESKLNKHLNKIGIKHHKGMGIIDYIKKFAGGVGKLFIYIIKGDHEKAKELLKSIEKEDILDFLYKLDLGTLHLVTGPLHMLDAWTGHDFTANIKQHMKKAENVVDVFKAAIEKVKHSVAQLFSGDKQKVMLNHVTRIEKGIA